MTPRPRILVLASGRPPLAAGEDWARRVEAWGGEAFRPTPGQAGVPLTWEEVLEFDPQGVLLACPPREAFGVEDWMAVEGWNRVEAAAAGRVAACPPEGWDAAERLLAGWFGGRGPSRESPA